MEVTTSFARADDLFIAVPSTPGRLPFADLDIRRRSDLATPFERRGCGLYGIYFDNRLLYVGMYRGKKTSHLGGDVTSFRWDKHLTTLTFRGRRLSMNKRPSQELAMQFPESPLTKMIAEHADADRLFKDGGAVTALNRMHFAAVHWDEFSVANHGTLFRGFGFSYSRIAPHEMTTEDARKQVEQAEHFVVRSLQPPANHGTPNWSVGSVISREQAVQEMEDALRRVAPISNEA